MSQMIDAARASMRMPDRIATVTYRGVDVPLAACGENFAVLDAVAKFVEDRADAPLARAATAGVDDLASLIAYVNRQKLDGQTVGFARKEGGPVVVVAIDWHRANDGAPGWCRDRVTYRPKLSRQWVEWTSLAKAKVGQDAFADFLEDHLDDVSERGDSPRKLDLLQMARDLHVSVGSKFQRTVDPSTGDVTLAAITDSGQSKTKIPREFVIAIPVFEGSDVLYAIRVGLKLELVGADAFFHVRPKNTDVALDDAFGDVKNALVEKCAIPIFAGVP
jgi:uncharacterized protein YfdQ (DUF2303 family)